MATKVAEAPTAKAAELYQTDFYAWTQAQAAAIRSLRANDRLDALHVAEEIEDLGNSELQAVESYIEQIIAHLLKLDHSGFDLPRGHWRHEIVAFRANLRRKLSPSIERKVRGKLAELYDNGRNLAAAALEGEPDLGRRLPKSCPYDWAAITERAVIAAAGLPQDGPEARPRPRSRRKEGP